MNQVLIETMSIFNKLVKTCIVCDSINIGFVLTIKSNQYYMIDKNNYNVYFCRDCGLYFINPMPADKFLEEHYNRLFDHENIISQSRIKENNIILNDMINSLNETRRVKRSEVRFYEIGIGKGGFIRQAKEFGFQVRGNELSSLMTVKQYDFPVDNKVFQSYNYSDAFDIVYSSHVLEHLNDPKSFAQAIHKSLKKGGIAVIRVPNLTSSYNKLAKLVLGKHYYQNILPVPNHLVMFNKDNLALLFQRNGFKVEKVTTMPLLENLSVSYMSVFARAIILRVLPLFGYKIIPTQVIISKDNTPRKIKKFVDFMFIRLRFIDKIFVALVWPLFNRFDMGEELYIVSEKE